MEDGSEPSEQPRETPLPWGKLGTLIAVRFSEPVNYTMILTFLYQASISNTNKSFNGLMSGNVAVVKSVMAEISDKTNRPRMMAMLPLIWNLGSAVGASAGGLLANPVEQYPMIFGNGWLFKEYPYLLPCLFGSLVTVVGLVLGFTKFEETLVIEPSTFHQTVHQQSLDSCSSSLAMSPATESTALIQTNKTRQKSIRELMTPTVVRVFATNIFIGLAMAIREQAYPIYAATDLSDGGLGFSPRSIGISMAAVSPFVVFVQLVTYPRMERRLGALKCYQYGQKLLVMLLIVFPLLAVLANLVESQTPDTMLLLKQWVATKSSLFGLIVLWTFLIVLLMAFSAVSVFISTGINLLTANFSPSRTDLGVMNGVQQLCMGSTRLFGPLASGAVWSWSIKHGLPYPFDSNLVWSICALLGFWSYKLSMKVPDSVNEFKPDEDSQASNECRSE
ncbi:hypothetical protein GGI07_005238 [Coemansia sp. Benny D115]|nr:hypothetical protein GGI07_005238 [Coemansia sp. Benny D115]